MAAESSIWNKEISLRRRRAEPVGAELPERSPPRKQSADWTTPKREELWVAPLAQTPGQQDVSTRGETPVLDFTLFQPLHPRFRDLGVLTKLVKASAEEFPHRVEEWQEFLPRLAESAVNGVLPPDRDPVVRTLFRDLLQAHPEPPKGLLRNRARPKPKAQDAPKQAPQPFWSKEIRFGRSSKPKAEPAPKHASAPVRKQEASPGAASRVHAEAAPDQPSPSFWRKEINLRKRPEMHVEVARKERSQPLSPKPASQPWWKREVSLGRTPKPNAEAAAQPSSQPWWKREVSLGRTPKPKAEAATKPPSQPWWKREVSLGRTPKPKAEAAAKPPSQPLLKRELRLSLPKLPTLDRRRPGSGHEEVKLVGLRIGSSQLAAAVISNNGSAELQQLARTPLQRGVVTTGEVRDPEALAQALKRFFAEHRLPRRGIRLGVATSRIGVRVIELPVMEDPQLLANAIRFRAQEVIPIPIGEAVLDHVVLGEIVGEGGEKLYRVLLVFAHRGLVDGYTEACQRAGLKLAGIDFDAFALLRALSRETDENVEQRAALVAVAIGHERTIFAVSEGPVCDFARVLDWGGASLDAALARALELTPEQAEQVKRGLSLSDDSTDGGLSSEQLVAARSALRQELQVLARELVSSLQFYQSRPNSLDIGEVLLTGGGAQLSGIEAELARQLGMPVRLGDPLGRVTLGDKVSRPAHTGSLAIAVGLGIDA